jgi:hypothetical protein
MNDRASPFREEARLQSWPPLAVFFAFLFKDRHLPGSSVGLIRRPAGAAPHT